MREISNLEIEVYNWNVDPSERIVSSSTSKGNQQKWRKDGYFLKADNMGYEGLAECLASELAHYTNIGDFASITDYYLCTIIDGSNRFKGCMSKSFLKAGETLLTLQQIMDLYMEKGIRKKLSRMSSTEKIELIVNRVVEITGLKNFGEWLTALLEFDKLILNEDRHMNNIAIVASEDGKYRLMSLFDNGLSFCSDTARDYPMQRPLMSCIKAVKAKPFNVSFGKQVEACRNLYGRQLKVNISSNEINTFVFDKIDIYSKEICKRVLNILLYQLKHVL